MTRVLLVDDHTLVRHSLTQVLSQTPGLTVIGDASDGNKAIDMALRHQPDVVIMDIDMPGIAAFDAAATIRARCPGTKVVFLSAFTHDRYIEAALKCGAMAFVTKNESTDSVIRAIRAVADGQTYFSPEVQSRLVIESDGVRLSPTVKSRTSLLSSREVEVLRYIAQGLAKKEIAALMHLSVKTVENHAASVMSALDIHDRVELTRFAIREGLIEP